MSPPRRARTAARRRRSTVLAALVVTSATVVGVLVHHSPSSQASSLSTSTSSSSSTSTTAGSESPSNPPLDRVAGDHAPVGGPDGVVADGVTVFDTDVPAVANLDPALLGALRRAADEAEKAGVRFLVN